MTCAKQTVTATIITPDGRRFVGTNYALNPQLSCPRGDMPSGVGYELCQSVCQQVAHAEVNAIAVAGAEASGATLYLEGHSYACGPCTAACDAAGITEIVIGSPPPPRAPQPGGEGNRRGRDGVSEEENQSLADRMFDGQHAQSQFEDALSDMIEDFDRIGHDYYDCSLEIHGAPDALRLGLEVQQYIAHAGFSKVYVNHKDGWETHYGVTGALPARGWRRRYVSDVTADTTNVIAGEPNPGYYEISYWPDGWTSPGCADWLETGYMRLVPDAFEHTNA